jgi:hypothetical protein
LESANPAAYSAKGYGLGIQAGAEEAANRFKQQQMALQQQKAAQDEAQMQAEMGLRQQAEQDKNQQFASDLALQQQHQDLLAQTAAQKSQAVLSYQQAIQGGMDPTEAILQFGPAMGQQASPEAAAIREQNKQQAAYVPANTVTGAPAHFLQPGGQAQVIQMPETFTDESRTIEGREVPGQINDKTHKWQAYSEPAYEQPGYVSPREKMESAAQQRAATATIKKLMAGPLMRVMLLEGKRQEDYVKQHPELVPIIEQFNKAQQILNAAMAKTGSTTTGDPDVDTIIGQSPRGTSSSPVEQAKALHAAHPEWSRQQIIDHIVGGQ